MQSELDLKKKTVGGLKEALESRLSDRLRPKKAPEASVAAADLSGGEAPPVEGEGAVGALEEKVEAQGGDISKLSPEEQSQLEALYQKMGC